MTTGSIEYSPDYKSAKRAPLNVVFEHGMDRQRLNAERARLEREVIEAAKEWRKRKNEPTEGRLFNAVCALESLEDQQK